MDDFGTTIGFDGTSGYCINCGKQFGYNAIHPQCICDSCRSLPKGQQQLIEKKHYCHHCGKERNFDTDKYRKDGFRYFIETMKCEHCGRGI